MSATNRKRIENKGVREIFYLQISQKVVLNNRFLALIVPKKELT
jgi:hypothetical protein